jgi:cysteine-rich repeat protein
MGIHVRHRPSGRSSTRGVAIGLLFGAGLLVGSCTDDASSDGGPSPCIGGDLCVGELICVDGFCVPPGGSETVGDGDGDSGDGDGDGDSGDGDGDGDSGDGDGDSGDGDGDSGDGDGDSGDGDGDPGDGDGDSGDGDGDEPGVCGDGAVDDEEECDDGNADDTDACTSTCILATCGDGILHQDVEGCDDGNVVDDDGCSAGCVLESCGDGIVQQMEDCDDGDMDNTDACTNMCLDASCGDGFVQANVEDCDDGNMDDDNDGCPSNCILESRIVFVTSTMHTGNLGGLVGADAICNARAASANLSGIYKAWLSTDQLNGTPATRFVQSTVPYRKVDGVLVANNWADLIDGTIASPIDKTELNGAPPVGNTSCAVGAVTVWSATTISGTLSDPIRTCTNWTSTSGGSNWGRAIASDSTWTNWCSGGICSWSSPIYCFQQ